MREGGIALRWYQSSHFFSNDTGRLTVYERVLQRHHCDNENVHRQREANDVQVESHQALILLQTWFNKIAANDTNEEIVESGINDKVDNLLAAILKVRVQLACFLGKGSKCTDESQKAI